MTTAERLALLKVMVPKRFENEDDMLSAYLEIAKDKILAIVYPYGTAEDVPAKYHFKQIEIAQYLISKRGADYQTAHTENGIQRTYEAADVPDSMLRSIVPYCGAIKSNNSEDEG